MIVVDASAIVAIVRGEPDRRRFIESIRNDGDARLSAVNYVESAMVCGGAKGPAGRALFERDLAILQLLGLSVAPADPAQAEGAREAFSRYGRKRHPAALNLGDCFAYALAKSLAAPLLYKGDDFAKTDIRAA